MWEHLYSIEGTTLCQPFIGNNVCTTYYLWAVLPLFSFAASLYPSPSASSCMHTCRVCVYDIVLLITLLSCLLTSIQLSPVQFFAV